MQEISRGKVHNLVGYWIDLGVLFLFLEVEFCCAEFKAGERL